MGSEMCIRDRGNENATEEILGADFFLVPHLDSIAEGLGMSEMEEAGKGCSPIRRGRLLLYPRVADR